MKHFQLHFEPETYVLYEENNNKYYRKPWREVSICKGIKRLHYNTKNWKHYIIIDIDNEDIYKYREQNLPEPNFILANKDKVGGHLFYVLNKGIYYKNEYFVKMWEEVHKNFTITSGGDTLAKGYVGKFINSCHFDYIEIEPYPHKIQDLYNIIHSRTVNNQAYSPTKLNPYITASKKKTKPLKTFKSLDLIVIGERNNTIFDKVRKYAYIHILKLSLFEFEQAVHSYIDSLNNSLLSPLEKSEIVATATSIIKYCISNKQSIESYNNSHKSKNRGIMELPVGQELGAKQKLGALYVAEQKRKKTIFNLRLSIIEMKAKELNINVSSLSKVSKISKKTIYRYREKLTF